MFHRLAGLSLLTLMAFGAVAATPDPRALRGELRSQNLAKEDARAESERLRREIAKLNAQLPQLREEAAKMQALALEAGELARQPAPQVTPMTRDTLTASLAARSITPQALAMTGDYAKLQLDGVAFANLYSWLEAQRRENRIAVQDAAITAGTPAGQVDAALTLRQNTGEASR